MASTQVVLEFLGDGGPLLKTLDKVESKASAVLGVIGKMGAVGAGASAFTGLTGTVMTLGAALTTIAPAALVLPGIILGAAVAAQTAKLAFSGFGDAVAGDAEAMAKLAPAAQNAAKATKSLGPAFDAMKLAVQQEMFRGLAPEIGKTGAALLAVGTESLPKVSAGFNGMAKEALAAARTPVFTGNLDTIITNTAGALDVMRDAGANALKGFVGLGEVGSTYLPAIGTAVDGVAAKFNRWVQSGVEDGSIKAMIDGALAGFRQIGAVISGIGSVFSTVWGGINAGLGAGATPLGMLAEKIEAFQQALASPQAQAALTALGTAIRAISDAFNAVLPHVISFAAMIATVILPAVTGLAGLIEQNAGAFTALAIGVAAVVLAVKAVVAVAAIVRTAIMAWTAVQWLLNAAMAANPIGIVIAIIAALVAAVIYAYNESETFRNIVNGAWEAVKTGIGAAVDFIKGVLAWFGELPGLAAGWFGGMKDAALAKGGELLGWIQGIPGRVMGFLGGIGNLLLDSGRALIDGFWNGIKGTWDGLVRWFQDQLAWFRGLWPFSPAKWGPFSGRGYVTYSGEALVGDFAGALAAGMPAVGAAAQGLMSAAAGPLSGAMSAPTPLGSRRQLVRS